MKLKSFNTRLSPNILKPALIVKCICLRIQGGQVKSSVPACRNSQMLGIHFTPWHTMNTTEKSCQICKTYEMMEITFIFIIYSPKTMISPVCESLISFTLCKWALGVSPLSSSAWGTWTIILHFYSVAHLHFLQLHVGQQIESDQGYIG